MKQYEKKLLDGSTLEITNLLSDFFKIYPFSVIGLSHFFYLIVEPGRLTSLFALYGPGMSLWLIFAYDSESFLAKHYTQHYSYIYNF